MRQNPNKSESLLEPLALAQDVFVGTSEIWLERYAITQNPNTCFDTLQALAFDANCIVRAAAQAKLERRCQQL